MVIPSEGCQSTFTAASAGRLLNDTILWNESGLPSVSRNVLTYVPSAAKQSEPLPLVLVFHGWGGHNFWYQTKYTFGPLAEQAGFLAVYPQGMSDVHAEHTPKIRSSWNTLDTIAEPIESKTLNCDLDRVEEMDPRGEQTCYHSCILKYGKCHRCSWTTCYNDLAFAAELMDRIEKKYCIDRSRVYAYGCSNGGIFVHSLVRHMPERFAAVATGCGGKPHRGYERNFTKGGKPVSLVLFQGDADFTIPAKTPTPITPWWDGYIYANDSAVMDAYKDYNGCTNPSSRPYNQPPHVDSQQMTCTEHGYDCEGGTKVVECKFVGGHDLVLGMGRNGIMDGPELAWNFFCQHSHGQHCILPQVNAVGVAPPFFFRLPLIVAFGVLLLLLNLLMLWAHRRWGCNYWKPVASHEEMLEADELGRKAKSEGEVSPKSLLAE